MKWEGHRESENVEDRRGQRPGGLRVGGRGIGIGTIVVALVVGWLFGINPLTVLGLLGGEGQPVATHPAPPAGGQRAQDPQARFVSVVLADTEEVWRTIFTAAGRTYREPRLVIFRDATDTACGEGQKAMGPFYCPADAQVYLDLGFFETLHRRLGAPGDFAQAYVVAHEVAHHVQSQLGVTARAEEARRSGSRVEANQISVRLELQADCLAGVWAHHSQRGKGWLDAADLEEALNAAAQIGDDTLQRQAGGRVVRETFTHGSSEQRQRWFRRGLQGGSVAQCDTFDRRVPL